MTRAIAPQAERFASAEELLEALTPSPASESQQNSLSRTLSNRYL